MGGVVLRSLSVLGAPVVCSEILLLYRVLVKQELVGFEHFQNGLLLGGSKVVFSCVLMVVVSVDLDLVVDD